MRSAEKSNGSILSHLLFRCLIQRLLLGVSYSEQLDPSLRAGTASFPEEEVTFVGMMERAVAEIRSAELPASPGGHEDPMLEQRQGP